MFLRWATDSTFGGAIAPIRVIDGDVVRVRRCRKQPLVSVDVARMKCPQLRHLARIIMSDRPDIGRLPVGTVVGYLWPA